MVLLKKLQLNNYLSHEDTELTFGNNEKLLLDGLSGSGKSSIVEAITWCLYGQGRGDNRFLVKRGAKKATVKLVLFDDTTKKYYHLIRSVTDKKHELEVLYRSEQGEHFIPVLINGIRGLQEFIEKEILHCSYALFVNSICYQQGNPEWFANQPATKRKDLLLEIIRATDYDEYYEKTRELISEKTALKIHTEGGINIQQTRLVILEEAVKDLLLVREKEELETELKLIKEQLGGLLKLEEAQSVLHNKEAELVGELRIIDKAIEVGGAEIRKLNEEITKLESVDLITLQLQQEEYNQVLYKLSLLDVARSAYYKWVEDTSKLEQLLPIDEDIIQKEKKRRDDAIKQITELKKNNETKCIHCGKICTRCEARLVQSTKYFEEQVNFSEYNINTYEKNLKEKDQALKALGEKPEFKENEYIKLVAKRDELGPIIKKIELIGQKEVTAQGIKKEIEQKEKAIEELTSSKLNKKSAVESLVNQFIDYSAEHIRIQNLKEATEQKIFEYKMKISRAEEALKEKETIETEINNSLAAIKKIDSEIESLQLLKEAFGNNGIKAIIIDYIIPKLEDRINVILSELSDFRVRLDTQKSGAGKEVVLEGLFLSVINEQGEQLDYSNYSGGEKLKIAVSISEALAELQKIGFRIMDEIFIGLDEASTEGFVNVLQKLQQRFSQLLCISHLRNIKDLFQKKILVTKLNGTSIIS